MTEQRKSARHRAFLGARITTEALAGWSAAGTVKNIGGGGARIALSPTAILPDTFRLEIARHAPASVRLVWHRDGVVGVSFDAKVSDRADVAPDAAEALDDATGSAEQRHVAPGNDNVLKARIAAIVDRRATVASDRST